MSSGQRSRSGRAWRAAIQAILGLALIGALAIWPSAASAGPAHYIYEVCDSALPAGNTPGAHFTVNPGVALVAGNNCAQPGGALSITETGHVSATFGIWDVPIDAPPGGHIESTTVSGASCGAGPGTKVFAFEQGWPSNCGGESQRIFHGGGGIFGATIFLGCDGNFPAGCEAGPTIFAHYIAANEVDPVAPKLEGLAGSLLGNGLIRGHQDLSVDASDVGGGLSKVSISVNGLPAAQPDTANCDLAQANNLSVVGTVAVTVTPCPTKLKASWTLDTASFPFHDGANTVQVCASDYASLSEPNTTCTAAQTINVDNSCAESSVTGGEVIDARFESSRSDELTVPYAQAANVSGELTNSAGDAISGATVCVEEQTQGSDGGLVPLATTKTDASGHFTYKLAAGPNRAVLLGYRHDRFQVAHTIHYYAHSRPTLKLSRKKVRAGGRIRISGRVPGPGAGGRVVVLQASAPHSKRWYTFNRATTNEAGFFHSRYRFDATTATTAYRIRAVAPRQAGLPYEAGHSKPARIRVLVGR